MNRRWAALSSAPDERKNAKVELRKGVDGPRRAPSHEPLTAVHLMVLKQVHRPIAGRLHASAIQPHLPGQLGSRKGRRAQNTGASMTSARLLALAAAAVLLAGCANNLP